jgi:hypothetical protein
MSEIEVVMPAPLVQRFNEKEEIRRRVAELKEAKGES